MKIYIMRNENYNIWYIKMIIKLKIKERMKKKLKKIIMLYI